MRVTVELSEVTARRVRGLIVEGEARNEAEAVVQIVQAYFEMVDDLESGHVLVGRLEQD